MTPSIRLGRLFGIEIGFNWSLLFIFVLVVWTLAVAVLPYDVPHQPAVVYWATGVVGAVVFNGSLLAHELSPNSQLLLEASPRARSTMRQSPSLTKLCGRG